MALSPEQKAANQEARRTRARAWRERYKAREAAEAAGLAEIAASDIMTRHERADADFNALLADRNAALTEIDRRIAALQEERKAMAERYSADLGRLRAVSSAIWDEKMAAERELQKRLDEQFPDLAGEGRWSAACWERKRASLPSTHQEQEQ